MKWPFYIAVSVLIGLVIYLFINAIWLHQDLYHVSHETLKYVTTGVKK